MLGTEDLGYRVVVRRIIGIRDNRPIYGDLLGELVDVSETQITVRTRAGAVTVDRTAVTAAKRVPDRRRPSATEALERVAAEGWPAPDQQTLGDWLLRAAAGWTNRANSALAVGDPGRPLPDAVDAVVRWYEDRGIRPAVMVPSPVGGRVTAELRRRGWVPQPAVLVQTAPLGAVPTADGDIRLDPAPSEAWLAVVAANKGSLPAAARHVLSAVRQVRFARVDARSPAPIAIGRGVVTGDWLGVSLVEVAPEHRRKGIARQVVGALAGWAAGLGARHAYLQVQEHNAAAVALYARLGFTTHHTYTTWNPA